MNKTPESSSQEPPFERFLWLCAQYWAIAPKRYPRDDNVRKRLTLNGLKAKWIPKAKVLHPLEPGEIKREVRRLEKDSRQHDEYVFPQFAIANGENWGREFDEIIYDKVGCLLNGQSAGP